MVENLSAATLHCCSKTEILLENRHLIIRFSVRNVRLSRAEVHDNDQRSSHAHYGGWGEESRSRSDYPKNSEKNSNSTNDNASTGEQETRKTYVPEETEESHLFENSISSGINFNQWDKILTSCSGQNVPSAIDKFEDAKLDSRVMQNITKSGYSVPTPVQKCAIPCILAGRNIMACAQTGSGKTAAFLLPIINMLLNEGITSNYGVIPQKPRVLIVAPTRELAVQIKDEARKFASGCSISSVVLYGGTSVAYQISTLSKGCHILIGTPGRLLDFVRRGKVNFSQVRYFVLDEADRMLDMGFLPEIRRMIPDMPAKEQRLSLMFSATFPEEVRRLGSEFFDDYIFLTVGAMGGASSDVIQTVLNVSKLEKREQTLSLLKDNPDERTLVFVETKKMADFLACYFSSQEVMTTSIHGDRYQSQREQALRDFKSGKMKVLVATAVAARGLDIRGIDHVINYDLPQTIEEYVHRIGRTGRVGNSGKATSFFDSDYDSALISPLVKVLENTDQVVPNFLVNGNGSSTATEIQDNGAIQQDDDEWNSE